LPTRTNLIPVGGITSSYSDPKNPSVKLDISKLTGICFLTPDTNQALQKLNLQIQLQGGTLFVSDMFRSWDVQAKAYNDWIAGRRDDYAAPPGQSFHMAGRAIDIDTANLSFAGKKKADWLKIFWSIALPIGWAPIISKPDAGLSESWHFQFLGKDWAHLVGKSADGEIAKCAILDAGLWDSKDPLLSVLFLQSQCNRLSERPGCPPVLRVDGDLGPKTKAFISALLGPSWTVQSATQRLINL
jgi:hypothetical protein